MSSAEGHRDRLRQRFQASPEDLAEVELLELLLTYAIPRRDVASLAETLLTQFGGLSGVFSAGAEELGAISGMGESSILFFQVIQKVITQSAMSKNTPKPHAPQLSFLGNSREASLRLEAPLKERPLRLFANDEVANTLEFLPQAANFADLEAYKNFLDERLPYNASETRIRRARYVLDRFYPDGSLDNPLTYFLKHSTSQAENQAVIFYHMLKAEPLAAHFAEEMVWPALPVGRLERESMRDFVLRYLPDASRSSQVNMLRALFNSYELLGVGTRIDTSLRFQLHTGSLAAFVYILTSEYSAQEIISFDKLFSGPLHRWLLWDREWLIRQLYNLRDLGIVAKIAEIDTVRQFNLAVDQAEVLHIFFEESELKKRALREN